LIDVAAAFSAKRNAAAGFFAQSRNKTKGPLKSLIPIFCDLRRRGLHWTSIVSS
jgi:hypothetical protein